MRNKRGSTPLHLAVQNSGRGGTGTAAAREAQQEIIRVLLSHGARPTDKNAAGRSVHACATADWIRALLSYK
jgi:ankyrin repeat protein